MSNPPFPTDSGPGANGSSRRAGLRLSEADVIASARLDVLGDGSLKEALAGVADGDPRDASPQDPAQLSDLLANAGVPPFVGDGTGGGAPLAASASPAGIGLPTLDLSSGPLTPASFEPAPAVYGNTASRSGLPPTDLRQPLIGVQVAMEVSSILSALDAAEKRAGEMSGPQVDMFAARVARAHEPIPLASDDPGVDARALGLQMADMLAAEAATDAGRGPTGPADPAWVADGPLPPPAVDSLAPLPVAQAPMRAMPGEAAMPIAGAIDTAAKLIADAGATAEALEGLKRLLERQRPALDVLAPSVARERAVSPPPLPTHAAQSPMASVPFARMEPLSGAPVAREEALKAAPASPVPFARVERFPTAPAAPVSRAGPPAVAPAAPVPFLRAQALPAGPDVREGSLPGTPEAPAPIVRVEPFSAADFAPPMAHPQAPAEAPAARAEPSPAAPAQAPPGASFPKQALPVKSPLPLPVRPTRSQGIDVRGFLAGFGLSLAVGVLLYLFMTTG